MGETKHIRFNEQTSKVMLMTKLKNKPLFQVHSLKYLGIIFDNKLTFREHMNYMAEKCTKFIFALSKSSKRNLGLNKAALKAI
jgi:hypothetical protein